MQNPYETWFEISLSDLFYAFRKAKVDCFYETSIRVAEKFIRYEEDLGENLVSLLKSLQEGKIADLLTAGIGNPVLFPKKVGTNAATEDRQSHSFFSDARRSFLGQKRQGLVPEFRMIGDFSVEMHIISALWVNLVGHKYDAALAGNALASRLRRYRQDSSGGAAGNYHLEAIGSFEPYYAPYKKWRDSGLKAIETSLNNGQGVVALTLDVSNFYHSIDPEFAVNANFLDYAGIKLNEFEIEFTRRVIESLSDWSERCQSRMTALGSNASAVGGLPIGLSVVRLISNCLLLFLDKEMETSVFPIYYARYVDDIFLVLRDNENFESQDDVWHMLQLHIPALKQDQIKGSIELKLPTWAGNTHLRFQPEKQKCFFLSGASGVDLLANIAAQIREVSSERRLMPLPEQLDQTQSARALTATDTSDEADSLRRADGLTLRRLGWSVLLRTVEVLAKDLRAKDWNIERSRFYDFAHDHVIRPDKILEQIDRIPRLFSISVSLGDWKPAFRILRETISAIYALQEATDDNIMKINGQDCQQTLSEVWDETRNEVRRYFREALVRSMPLEQGEPRAKAFHSLIEDLGFDANELLRLALSSRETDWSRLPYKEHIRQFADRHTPHRNGEEELYNRYEHESHLRKFLERSVGPAATTSSKRVRDTLCSKPYESLVPYLFPTRAYTPEEIALYLPDECIFGEQVTAAHAWAEYTRAVRGVWVRTDIADETTLTARDSNDDSFTRPFDGQNGPELTYPKHIVLDQGDARFPIRIGITSFKTSDATWSLSATGKPDLSPQRYKAIAKIVNQALREEKRPDYLVFPELSIPERWVQTISNKLREGRISLIAGLDYFQHAGNLIDSSAVLVLDDRRLGYSTALQIRQRKSQPAPGEEQNLLRSHGQNWRLPETELKPVYVHNDFHFSVLVCSELQNIEYRSHLQGSVDCLFVVSWNRDIETFSALVDSACLDVHAYVALSNNLQYGDSRVRGPAKDSFRRDLCRVRGGVNDQLVVVEIDPRPLRAQQSRAKRWPHKDDRYKPAPEGFKISISRQTTPS